MNKFVKFAENAVDFGADVYGAGIGILMFLIGATAIRPLYKRFFH